MSAFDTVARYASDSTAWLADVSRVADIAHAAIVKNALQSRLPEGLNVFELHLERQYLTLARASSSWQQLPFFRTPEAGAKFVRKALEEAGHSEKMVEEFAELAAEYLRLAVEPGKLGTQFLGALSKAVPVLNLGATAAAAYQLKRIEEAPMSTATQRSLARTSLTLSGVATAGSVAAIPSAATVIGAPAAAWAAGVSMVSGLGAAACDIALMAF